jgi:hypothetical protein
MSALITTVTRTIILSNTYDWLSTNPGLIVLILLVALLLQKELLRALADSRSKLWLQTLDTMIVPLVTVAGLILFLRLINLIFPL